MVDRDALCLHRVQGNHREARNSIRLGEIQVRPAQRHRCESSADHLSPYPNSGLRHSTPRPWFGEKLAVQLRNENLASTLSDLFLQTSVYADLKLDEYLKQLKALKDRVTASGSRVF